MKKIATLIILLSFVIPVIAQDWDIHVPKSKVEDGTVTLIDYQEAFARYCDENNVDANGHYFVNGKKETLPGWKLFKRWEWFMRGEVDAGTQRLPQTDAWTEWQKYLKENPQAGRSALGDWVSIGPSTAPPAENGLGRLNCIAFHPTDAGTWWVGAATGGIWRTTDYGSTWTCLSDDVEIMGVSDIIIPDDYYFTQTIYIATGDRDKWEGSSLGVYKSINAGATWQPTDLVFDRWDFEYVNRLLKHPDNDAVIYAATTDGLYKTTNGGANFTLISSHNFMDMEFSPDNPDIIHASTKRKNYGDIGGVYRSVNGGNTWTLSFSDSDASRTEIAVTPDDASKVYAVVSKPDGGLLGIYRSSNAGMSYDLVYEATDTTQNLLGRNCDGTSSRGQGRYDLCIAVNPEDCDEVFVGGINKWKSTDGGTTFTIVSAGGGCGGTAAIVHVDHHNLTFRPGTTELYNCNDGGLYRSTDLGATWTDLSAGLAIGQIYRIGTAQTTPMEVITGYQDCGSKVLSGGTWDNVTGGDGMHCLIDPVDHSIQFASTQNGHIRRTMDHWTTVTSISDNLPILDTGDWVTPYMLDPNNPSTLFVGMSNLYKSYDRGGSYAVIASFPPNLHPLRIMDIAPSNSNIMAVANIEYLYHSIDGGFTWTNITSNLPFGPSDSHLIMDITFKHNDPNTFWITCSSYDNYGVLKTTDGGNTWTNITHGLPDIPVRGMVQNILVTSYDELYCATAMGVFVKLGDQPWLPFNNGLPKVYCNWLDIYYNGVNSKLRVGTWGRGAWESDLYSVESNMPGIWSGIASDNWWDANNWNYRVVPDINSDVTIPGGCPNYPVISGAWTEINSLTIENGASLTIEDDILIVEENADISGNLTLTDAGGSLKIKKDLYCRSGANVNLQDDGAIIIIQDDLTVYSGANVTLDHGWVQFTGGLYNSSIYKYGGSLELHNVIVDKNSPRNLTYSSLSSGDYTISGDLHIYPGDEYIHDNPGSLTLNGNFINSGEFRFEDGGLVYGGGLSVLSGVTNSYFNDLTIDGSSAYLSLDFDAYINGDLQILNGTLDPLSNSLHLLGAWDNQAGASGFVQSNSNVYFEGSSLQTLTGNETFHMLTLNNSSPGIQIQSGTIECAVYNWTSGMLMVGSGGTFIAQDLLDDAIVGLWELDFGGTIELHSDSFIGLKGDVDISGGSFHVYGGVIDSYWPQGQDASLTMSGGEFIFHDYGIVVNNNSGNTFSGNITGGSIITYGNFTTTCDDFNPTGGEVVLLGINGTGINMHAGSSFYDLIIDQAGTADHLGGGTAKRSRHQTASRTSHPTALKTILPSGTRSGPVTLSSDIHVVNDLDISSGEFDIGPYTAQVDQDANVYGTLVMNDPAGQLDVGFSIIWKPGSNSNVTDGNITFGNSFSFENGANAILSGNNVVTAEGTSTQILYGKDDNSGVNDLVIDNSSIAVEIFSVNNAFRVYGDLTVNPNCELLVDDSLWVGNFLDIPDLATLTVNADGILHCNNDFDLNGECYLTDGVIRVMNDFRQLSSGLLSFDDGTFIVDRPYSASYVPFSGTTDMDGGVLQVSYDGIYFSSTSSLTGYNGTIKVGWIIKAIDPGVFEPLGIDIEMINGNAGQIWITGNNSCRHLTIKKSPASSFVYLTDSLYVKGDVSVDSGNFLTLSKKLKVSGNMNIDTNGMFGPGSGIVEINGNWNNYRGTTGFSEATSTVIFAGSGFSQLYTNETFYKLFVEKTGTNGGAFIYHDKQITVEDSLYLQSGKLGLRGNSFLHANKDLYIEPGGELFFFLGDTNAGLHVDGHWEIKDGGMATLTNGTAEIDSNLVLDGNLEIQNSDLEVHGTLYPNVNSTFILNSGNVLNDAAGPGVVRLKGKFRMHDGIFELTDRTFQPVTSFDDSITGGTIRIGRTLDVASTGVFNPYGGTVEFIGSSPGLIDMAAGNTIYDLIVNKSGNVVTLNDNLVVSNDILISNGTLAAATYSIEVQGDWTNNVGAAGFHEGTGLVTFSGTGPDTIHTDEKFYNLYIDKTGPSGDLIELPESKTLTSTNEFQVINGALYVNHGCTVDVRHLTINSGAGLLFDASSYSTYLNVSGNWDNLNSSFTDSTGFSYGKSEVTFTGGSGQALTSTGGEEFYKLTIDKSSRWFRPNNSVTVIDVCKVEEGEWDIGTPNLTHYFYEDLQLMANGVWSDSTARLNFVGNEHVMLMNNTGATMVIYDLIVDQPVGDPFVGMSLLGNIRCRNWAWVKANTLGLNSQTLMVDERLQVESGAKVFGPHLSKIRMADGATLILWGGSMDLYGSEASPCMVTNQGSGYYTFSVINGGHFTAKNTIVEYTNDSGVYFYNDGKADTVENFQNCVFRNGKPGGALMTFSTDQVVEFSDVEFPDIPAGGNYNVDKTNDAGSITFNNAFGAFSGPPYEDDLYGRVHWSGDCIWTGLVSTDWHTGGNWSYNDVPDDFRDVIVPDSTPNDPVVSVLNADTKSLMLEADAVLTLSGSKNLAIEENFDIWGELDIQSNASLTISDTLAWKPGSGANSASTGVINIFRDMIIENGSELNLIDGSIAFKGANTSHLICHQDSATIANLRIDKSSGAEFYFGDLSTGDLVIKNNLYNYADNYIVSDYAGKIHIEGAYVNYGGNFSTDNTHYVFSGDAGSYPLRMMSFDTFYDLTVASTTMISLDDMFSDSLNITGDLKIMPGPSGTSGIDANGVRINMFGGDWTNNVGYSGFIHDNNIVKFQEDVYTQSIYGNNAFYELKDNTSGTSHLRVMGTIEVFRNFTVDHLVEVIGNLYVYGGLILTDPLSELILQSNSYSEVANLYQGGALTCNSGSIEVYDIKEDYLMGDYNVNGGTVSITQDASHSIDLDADITITGGIFKVYGGNDESKWPVQINGPHPTLTISDGTLDIIDQGIWIETSAGFYHLNNNITGGTISTKGHFYCLGSDTDFSPDGGEVLLYGNSNSDCRMSDSGNKFYILRIAKTGGAAVKNNTETNIKNSLILQSGPFDDMGSPVNIGL